MLLEILESGQALYALAVACGLGLLARFTARTLYKRLIRETDNMALTKNRYLREFKQKAENTYRLNQGIQNTQVYLEKQIASYRFLGISLNGWANLSGQMTVLCFLLGGAGAFLAYWYRSDSYYIVLYGSMGILAGLLTLFADFGVNLSEKKSQLLCGLQDYLENSLFCRLARETAAAMEEGPRAVSRDSGMLDGGKAGGQGSGLGLRGGILRDKGRTGAPDSDRDGRGSTDNDRDSRNRGRERSLTAENGVTADGGSFESGERDSGNGHGSGCVRDGTNRGGREAGAREASMREVGGREPGVREASMREIGGREPGVREVSLRDGGGVRDSGRESGNRAGIRSIARAVRTDREAADPDGDNYEEERAAGRVARRGERAARRGTIKEPEEVLEMVKEKGGIDPDYLRRGLEQIAASREKSRSDDWLKELSPDELELVGEILKQYLE